MNSEGHDYESPFAIPHLWRKSAFTYPEAPSHDSLFHGATAELVANEKKPLLTDIGNDFLRLDLDLNLPDLESFHYGIALENIDRVESARAEDADSAPSVSEESGKAEEEDVWQLALDIATEQPQLRTWETFLSQSERRGQEDEVPETKTQQKRNLYLSDSGARVFDAALDQGSVGGDAGSVLQSAFFLKCLSLLGLGRSSALFQWGKEKGGGFGQTLERVRMSGMSLAAVEQVVKELGTVGACFVELRGFVEGAYKARRPLAARIALARCVQVALECLEQEVGERVVDATSLLQVLACFDVPGAVLAELKGLVGVSVTAKGDEEFMDVVREKVRGLEKQSSPFLRIHLDILDRVSRPWVQHISRRVGLSHGEIHLDGAVDGNGATKLVTGEESERINELATGLNILKASAPDHPLLNPAAWDVDHPDLNHSYVYIDPNRILEKAKKYEGDLMQAIRQYNAGEKHKSTRNLQLDVHPLDEESMAWEDNDNQQAYFSTIRDRFAQPPGQNIHSVDSIHDSLVDSLRASLRSLLVATTYNPQDHLLNQDLSADLPTPNQTRTPLLPLSPYLQAQSRLLNGTLLRLLFRTHNLRQHLSLHHSFSLFGNGIFIHRLTTALFSADASTAERRTGHVIAGESLGLRLDARSKWPPGGSELRLALMGILSESYHSDTSLHNKTKTTKGREDVRTSNRQLPGDLSFSIRELDDEEIDRILDPNSVFALDFLRLGYEAPPPLDVVIGEDCLRRYDEIFRFLLRLLRMIHVTTALKTLVVAARIERAFALEAYHFVAALAGYVFHVGIGVPWLRLGAALDSLERDLEAEDRGGGYGSRVSVGLDGLRALHTRMLESMRTRLLLRQKQKGVRDALDALFSRVLDVWARTQRGGAVRVGRGDVEGLRGEVRTVLNILVEMGKKGHRKAGPGKLADDRADLEALDMLRLRLDLNGFYTAAGEEDAVMALG